MFIGNDVEPLRAEAPLHAASTPSIEAVLAAAHSKDAAKSNKRSHVLRDSDCTKDLCTFYPKDAALRRTSSLRSSTDEIKSFFGDWISAISYTA
jgi:hypothetical protein